MKPYAVSDKRATLSLAHGSSNNSVIPAQSIDCQTTYAQAVVPDEELNHLRSIDFIKIDIVKDGSPSR